MTVFEPADFRHGLKFAWTAKKGDLAAMTGAALAVLFAGITAGSWPLVVALLAIIVGNTARLFGRAVLSAKAGREFMSYLNARDAEWLTTYGTATDTGEDAEVIPLHATDGATADV